MRIAVDFDNTLVRTKPSRYPEIEYVFADMIQAIKERQRQGDTIILFTCRTGEDLDLALSVCSDDGLQFDEVAEKKPQADVYIDDRGILPSTFQLSCNQGWLDLVVERHNREIKEE